MVVEIRSILFLVIINFISSLYLLGYCNVWVKKFENCDGSEDDKFKFSFTIKTVADRQYVNSTFIFAIPLDNNVKTNVSVDMLIGNQYVYVFTITERKACDAISKYFGEFWYDMERHAGIIPELCPIAKGRYNLHNFLLDWNKMTTLHSFPFGNLRFTFHIYNNKNTRVSCLLGEFTNNQI